MKPFILFLALMVTSPLISSVSLESICIGFPDYQKSEFFYNYRLSGLIPGDIDNDGVPDAEDNCPEVPNSNQRDKDKDGIGDACDPCNNNKNQGSCDDGDPCTTNDAMDAYCNCTGIFADSDADGVCDALDRCPGYDDNLDQNGNGMPDSCDICHPLWVDAGSCQPVYHGYNPMRCTTLEVHMTTGIPPFTVLWSTGEGSASISVCPSSTTLYKVTVTDMRGCTGTDDVTVEVMDVQCGHNNHNVEICHYNSPTNTYSTICQRSQLIQDHLDHGDYLGECWATPLCLGEYSLQVSNANAAADVMNAQYSHEHGYSESSEQNMITVFPNPADDEINIRFDNNSEGDAEINIFRMDGRIVKSELFKTPQGAFVQSVDVSAVEPGLYIIRILNNGYPHDVKIVVGQ